ncbi:MAG TPA: AraC family transcriptional regulator [Candidatus Eisenbacteria bacterium]|nr:AraC family transcriptional regulator [Candidatus Eisenbacteria bacterium]
MSIVLAGGFVERSGRAWVDAGAGTIRVSPASRHDIDFSIHGADCLILHPRKLNVPEIERSRFLFADAWLWRVIGKLNRRREAISRPLAEGEEPAAELVAQIERRLLGRAAEPPIWLRAIRAQLDRVEERRSVERLAAQQGVHRVHLARAFREHYGTTVREYERVRRLKRAWRLLASSALDLAEVADSAGYADQSHMTRDVRVGYGLTPGEVRARALHSFKTAGSRDS